MKCTGKCLQRLVKYGLKGRNTVDLRHPVCENRFLVYNICILPQYVPGRNREI